MLSDLLSGELPRDASGKLNIGALIVLLIQAGISFEIAIRIINYVRKRLDDV
jgi:hypothetical protein|tara:strand:+ start:98 stop:253 length:156 start_codon:yes stop_codon:yes gene_type:complete